MDEDVKDVVYFFIILDDHNFENSILNYKITETTEVNGSYNIEIKSYLSNFPFENYVILKDVNQLGKTVVQVLTEYFEKFD